MSLTVHVLITVTKAGFLEMCRQQKWLEPIQLGNRFITCIDAAESARVKAMPRPYITPSQAIWFDDRNGQIGYDGDFEHLKQASGLFVAPECATASKALAALEDRLRGNLSSGERGNIQAQLAELKPQIYPSPLMLCCEGLADAKAAGRQAEIVIIDNIPRLDVEVPITLQADVSVSQDVVLG